MSRKPRIINEISDLYSKDFNNINLIKENNNDIVILRKKNEYKFVLDSTYPFNKPKFFYINDINYTKILRINNKKFLIYLKKIYGLDCLCCSSLNCNNNWSPCNRLYHFIEEFNKNILIKKNIYIRYICDLIKKKYNCEFAYIESYF